VQNDDVSERVSRDVRERMLAIGDPFLVYVALPLAAAVATRELLQGRTAILPYAILQVVAGLALFFLRRASSHLRAWVILMYGVGLGTLALVAFGPLLGVGVIYTWTVVAAAGLVGRNAMIVTLSLSLVSMAVVAIGNVKGWLPPLPARALDFARAEPWLRFAATLGTAGAAIGLLTNRIIWTLEKALGEATEALERERVERTERERAQDALARAQRLEAVGRLAAGVAHDLNNSLAVVLCNAESLRTQDADDRSRLLSDLINAARSAEETTRQLTFLGRKDTEAGKSCVPSLVVEQLVRSVQRLLPPGIVVEVHGSSTRAVPLSNTRLEQVLLNLVLNARDAMPTGGTVRLSIEDRGEELVLTVADDGVGMAEEVRDRVFEPFFTTKEPGRGIGLGLSMVHGLVTEVGGKVDVVSAPRVGTTFTLTLPVVTPTATVPSEPRLPTARRARILLLEDEPFVLRAIQRVLRAAGHEVTSAVDGTGAEEALATVGEFDLLFTDAVVPGTDTSSVIAQFRERHPRAPVLVCSGFVREELVRRGIRAGEFFFLKKPFEPGTLRAAVDEALGAPPPQS